MLWLGTTIVTIPGHSAVHNLAVSSEFQFHACATISKTLDRDKLVPPVETTASVPAGDWSESAVRRSGCSRSDLTELPSMPSLSKQPLQGMGWLARLALRLVILVGLVAMVASIPVVNIFALGYLFEMQGRVARTGKVRSALYLLPAAERVGGILLGVWLWLLPIQFLAAAARDSWLISPTGTTAWLWIGLVMIASLAIAIHILMAIACGGGLARFIRPLSNARWLMTRWSSGEYWADASSAISRFAGAFRLGHMFRLGLLGSAAVYLWLAIPTFLFTVVDDVTSPWQVLGFIVGCATLTLLLLWLPFLLAHVSAAARWGAILEFATVRRLAGQTPFCWSVATAFLLACSTLPMLYTALLKNKIPPHDLQWDVMVVFLLAVVPARLLVSWVYHRATQQTGAGPSWTRWVWRQTNAAALCVGAGYYVYFLHLAATGGELGKRSVWQFHALLLPFPF